MSTALELVNNAGVTVFEGTSAGVGSGLPTGWTEDASNPANVDTHGGSLDLEAGAVTSEGPNNITQLGPGGVSVQPPVGTAFVFLTAPSAFAPGLNVRPAAGSQAIWIDGADSPDSILAFSTPGNLPLLWQGNRPTVPAVGAVTVQDVVDALVTLGLIKQAP